MNGRVCTLLFLCTGNSARSILAEAILNREGAGRFRAFSAGSFPKGEVNPMSIEVLGSLGFDTAGLRSKSWDEFARPDAPDIDFVITVCDDAAGEMCPAWPGRPMTAHWGIADPAAVEGPGKRDAFLRAFALLESRIARLLALPLAELDEATIKARLREIGLSEGATAQVPASERKIA